MIVSNCLICSKPAEIFLDKDKADAAFPICEHCLTKIIQEHVILIFNKDTKKNITLPFEIVRHTAKFNENPYVIVCKPEIYDKYVRLKSFLLENKT